MTDKIIHLINFNLNPEEQNIPNSDGFCMIRAQEIDHILKKIIEKELEAERKAKEKGHA